jgi:hypothetical protein
VEPRPTRGNKDGRTMLEKVQDRKKKANLEEPKGISCNPFSILSTSIISDIAQDTGIVLGIDVGEKEQSLLDIMEKDRNRKVAFDLSCAGFWVDKSVGPNPASDHGDYEIDDLCTLESQIIKSRVGSALDGKGEWTLIENRRKSKPKVSL